MLARINSVSIGGPVHQPSGMPPVVEGQGGLKREMFALSFAALFLEMMVIRWVPSVVHLVAYYANLMLLGSFLGLGAGAMASGRKWNLFPWFPLFLAADIGMLLLDRNSALGGSSTEVHFNAPPALLSHSFVLVEIFALNALLFVPLGQRMGVLFNRLPRLAAYAWDLAGSLCGTLAFGVFSLRYFSPALGLSIVMVVYLVIQGRRWWFSSIALFALVLVAIVSSEDPSAIWSPYYYITVADLHTPSVTASAPPAGLLTMKDPPAYFVKVNQFGYHVDATLNMDRYSPGSWGSKEISWLRQQYNLTYAVASGRDRILVVGAGGGCDVEAALLNGARHVDAVEIDPAIVGISRRFNSGGPYLDPRVSVYVDDARSYVAKATPGYDAVVFGFLDSQALFNNMNNVRLDGYVYTVESIRSAFRLLNSHGVLTLSFYLGKPWLGPKLYELVAEATGRPPVAYFAGNSMILCAPEDTQAAFPDKIYQFTRGGYSQLPSMDLPTDDWPFLYLIRRTVPSDYLVAIASLLIFSIFSVACLRGRSFGRSDIHFGLLGMGFLLLETKNISDCTLFFGATWFVSLVVITGILLMVMAANLVAGRLRRFSLGLYVPLCISLVFLIVVPRESILQFGFATRMLWTLLVVPLPVFFAGIIFSTTFRDAESPSAVFGANLIGAMVGGFCEYLSMAIGNHRLSMLVIAAYLGSMLMMASLRGRARAA